MLLKSSIAYTLWLNFTFTCVMIIYMPTLNFLQVLCAYEADLFERVVTKV